MTTKSEQIARNDARIAELEAKIASATPVIGSPCTCDVYDASSRLVHHPGCEPTTRPVEVTLVFDCADCDGSAAHTDDCPTIIPATPAPMATWEQGFTATIRAEDLSLALKRASYATERRSSLPILSHVRVDVVAAPSSDRLPVVYIEGTDLELRVTSVVNADNAVREGDEVTVGLNTRYLIEALRATGATTLAIKRPDPEDRFTIEYLAKNKGATLATMGTLEPMVMRHGSRIAVIMPTRC